MRVLITVWLLVWGSIAVAQSAEDDRSFITGLIEDTINSEEMTVRLINFEGALSYEATADAITIADPDGIWLRLDGLVIDWNRSALLGGRVEIETLSAERIELIRLPASNADALDIPNAEATPFALPELPVSIDIEAVSATEIILTEALLGEPVLAQFEGALTLGGGAGSTDFRLERTDSKTGRFVVDATYDNATRQLGVLLLAEEGQNGIAARLLNLPDRPSLKLEIAGDAPLDNFTGDIALATDGVDRVTGTAQVSRPSGTLDQAFNLNLDGDLRPLLADQYDPFFGDSTVLQVEGTSFGLGGLRLSNLVIAADQVALRGSARLDAQGWPEAIDLVGRLGSGDGTPVLLPLGDVNTYVSGMTLDVQYDAAQSDDWIGAFDITSLTRAGVDVDVLALSGGGTIVPGAGATLGQFSADLNYAARGLALDDPALSEAIGENIEGSVSISRAENAPLAIRDLILTGAGLSIAGDALIDGPDNRFQSAAELEVQADDFSRFAALTGLDLTGDGLVRLRGQIQPFDGIFDLFVTARTRDLALGIAQLDPALASESVLSLQVDRDETGTRLNRIRLANAALIAQGSATITSQATTATFDADMNDLGIIDPALSGTASLQADVQTDPQGVITLVSTIAAPRVTVKVDGVAAPGTDGYVLRGESDINIDDLTVYADLIGQRLAGGLSANLDGSYVTASGAADADVRVQTRNLETGSDLLDPVIAGMGTVNASATLSETQTLRLETFDVAFPNLTASGTAQLTTDTAMATFSAQLRDLGLIAPAVSGPATVQADVQTDPQGVITLAATLNAPQASATVDGVATPAPVGYAVSAAGTVSVDDLNAYSTLAGQRLGGGLSVDLDGTFITETGVMDADIVAQTRDLRAGPSTLDRIIAGLGRISASVSLSETQRLRLDALDVVFPNLTASGTVATSGADTVADLTMRLRDVALLAPDFSGPLVADVAARQDAAGWNVTADATGPANTAARATGRVNNNGQLDLNVTGSAPLALANIYIAPRQVSGVAQFDVSIDGPAALTSVRGPVTIRDARVSAPTLQQALDDVNGQLVLAGGTVRINISGTSANGGTVALSGPVDVQPPFQAALVAQLAGLVLRDPTLYRTEANGQVTVNGPLAGGARIAGQIDLGQVDVQVPSTGVSALGTLPEVTHLGPRMDVRDTLARAGVGVTVAPQQAQSGADYPVDLLIRAPSRIFVRGRGLDAELGGQLRLTGSTNALVPIGRFDLVRGRLSILGQRFELDEGFAQLQGDFSPALRLVASTEARTGTLVRIIVEGPADDIEVRFESTPELPQDEVLAQLLFGRDLSSISPLQAVQLASAVATLAGSGDGGLVSNLRQGLDLDDLDFVTDEDGNAGVRAGKYLSENVYTDVTIGSNGTSEINLNIDIDRNFTARGTLGTDGETSVGIFFERDY